MKTIFNILFCLCLAGALTRCVTDAPPEAGTIRQVYPQAQKYLAEAKKEEDNKRYKKAIKNYKKIAENYPLAVEAPYARFRKAQLHEALNDPFDAFDEYQKLIEKYPDSSYYTQALVRQKEMAFSAAGGQLKNKLFWTFDVSMDPTLVVKWLNNVCDNAPFSETAPQAKKILGDYLLKRNRLPEAIEAYQSLVDNYPNSSLAPEAQLKVAEIYANDRTTGARSYTNITRAQEAYEEFLLRFPGHSLVSKARKGLAEVRSNMVDRKLEIGEFYMNRMKDYSAALFCFEEVVAESKTNSAAAAKAQKYIEDLKKRNVVSQKPA